MKVIIFTTFLLFSINGFAFNWKKVTTNIDGDTFYVDVDSIKKHNGLVYSWVLSDFLEPIKGDKGNANSSISKYKIYCGEEKRIWLNVTYYSQSKGRGKNIVETSPNEVQYLKPNTVRFTLMKFACDNAR